MTRQRRPARQEDLRGNVAGQPAGCRDATYGVHWAGRYSSRPSASRGAYFVLSCRPFRRRDGSPRGRRGGRPRLLSPGARRDRRQGRRSRGWQGGSSAGAIGRVPLRSGAHRSPHAGHQRARGGRGAIGLQTGPPRPWYRRTQAPRRTGGSPSCRSPSPPNSCSRQSLGRDSGPGRSDLWPRRSARELASSTRQRRRRSCRRASSSTAWIWWRSRSSFDGWTEMDAAAERERRG